MWKPWKNVGRNKFCELLWQQQQQPVNSKSDNLRLKKKEKAKEAGRTSHKQPRNQPLWKETKVSKIVWKSLELFLKKKTNFKEWRSRKASKQVKRRKMTLTVISQSHLGIWWLDLMILKVFQPKWFHVLLLSPDPREELGSARPIFQVPQPSLMGSQWWVKCLHSLHCVCVPGV